MNQEETCMKKRGNESLLEALGEKYILGLRKIACKNRGKKMSSEKKRGTPFRCRPCLSERGKRKTHVDSGKSNDLPGGVQERTRKSRVS